MNIAVCGFGRAGKVLVRKILKDRKHKLCCVLCRDTSEMVHRDVGEVLGMCELDIPIISLSDSIEEMKNRKVDVVIDFSNKNTTLQVARQCKNNNISLVVCTTNFEKDELEELRRLGEQFEKGMIYAPNLTIGINLLMDFVEKISQIVTDFDFEIIERHPKGKKPITTTAKLIASCINREEVPISAIRLGGYVGVHEVTAANENERLTIIHESFSREAFANGAMMAANYIYGKSGYHEMKDVISELEMKVFI